MPKQTVVTLSQEDRAELMQVANSRSFPAGDVFRARLILALAAGQSYQAIVRGLRTSAPTITRWKRRFDEKGIDGLVPRHGGSENRVATAAVEAFLEEHPKVKFHFTPTYSSWLNQVEIWLAKIQRQVIDRGILTSVADLDRKLMRSIRAYTQVAKPIRWTYRDVKRQIHANSIGGTAQ